MSPSPHSKPCGAAPENRYIRCVQAKFSGMYIGVFLELAEILHIEWHGTSVTQNVMHRVLNRDVKFSRNLDPAPDRQRHRTTMDGLSVKPSIHLWAHVSYLALGPHVEPSTSPEPHVKKP